MDSSVDNLYGANLDAGRQIVYLKVQLGKTIPDLKVQFYEKKFYNLKMYDLNDKTSSHKIILTARLKTEKDTFVLSRVKRGIFIFGRILTELLGRNCCDKDT